LCWITKLGLRGSVTQLLDTTSGITEVDLGAVRANLKIKFLISVIILAAGCKLDKDDAFYPQGTSRSVFCE
jgi:hypothetical protein